MNIFLGGGWREKEISYSNISEFIFLYIIVLYVVLQVLVTARDSSHGARVQSAVQVTGGRHHK